MTDRRWSKGQPALGEILIRLLSLRARMDRLEAARRITAIAKTVRLLKE